MPKRTILLLMFIFLGLVACSRNDTANVASTENLQNITVPIPDAAAYRSKIETARQAFDSGHFEQAMTLAKEAAVIKPADNTAWSIYQQAAVAEAGDAYLRNLPEQRYRLDSEHFLADLVNGKKYFIIDVREPDEYAAGHIEHAINIPMRELTQNLDQLPDSKTHPILVYCHTQKRATHALVVLRELGYTNVFNLEGGYAAYQDWTANNAVPTPGPTATPEPEKPSC